ncbi:MAG: hypothetical protein KGD63_06900 [Candidatus Lokiarchaeota archaeon]|nr:hypothetical protein [Candidatus Lokiarchaeota archaeon]
MKNTEKDKSNVIDEVKKIYDYFSSEKSFSRLIPEVRTNISAGLPDAINKNDIAAIEGRITIINGYPKACGEIKFGMSNHTARLLLTAKKFDDSINIVMNIKYIPELIEKLKTTELEIEEIPRNNQSLEIREKEDSTMQWLIQECMKKIGRIPDIIHDKGAIGKEPMIRLFGKLSDDIIQILTLILEIIE